MSGVCWASAMMLRGSGAARCLLQGACGRGAGSAVRRASKGGMAVSPPPGRAMATTPATRAALPTAGMEDLLQGAAKRSELFAIVHVGGKQYKVTERDVIITNRLQCDTGSQIVLNKVLLVGAKQFTVIGSPLVTKPAVRVEALVVEQSRTAKIQVFKKKRRKGYSKRQGHRQDVTSLRITSISLPSADAATDDPEPNTRSPPTPAEAEPSAAAEAAAV